MRVGERRAASDFDPVEEVEARGLNPVRGVLVLCRVFRREIQHDGIVALRFEGTELSVVGLCRGEQSPF